MTITVLIGPNTLSAKNICFFYRLIREQFIVLSQGTPCDRHPSIPVWQKIYIYIKDRPACQCWERQQNKLIIDGMLSKPVASLGILCYLSRCLQLFADEDVRGRHKNHELFLPPVKWILFKLIYFFPILFEGFMRPETPSDMFDQCCWCGRMRFVCMEH